MVAVMAKSWKRETFKVAADEGTVSVDGITCGGLGLYIKRNISHVLGPLPIVQVVHLNTGHALLNIKAHWETACTIATKMLELTDWDFDGVHGYQNRDPELPAKFEAFVRDGGGLVEIPANTEDEGQARKIGRERW